MEYIAGCKRDFKPQTDFQYSCLNFITLQHIIEAVSGQSLRDFARENVFDVLGMKHTDYLPCLRDKNGKWINTVPLPENIAPTEKQPDGRFFADRCTTRLHAFSTAASAAMQAYSPAPKILPYFAPPCKTVASGTDIAFSARKA